jgi:hypothetical protein
MMRGFPLEFTQSVICDVERSMREKTINKEFLDTKDENTLDVPYIRLL